MRTLLRHPGGRRQSERQLRLPGRGNATGSGSIGGTGGRRIGARISVLVDYAGAKARRTIVVPLAD
jgi:hypothetical protein